MSHRFASNIEETLSLRLKLLDSPFIHEIFAENSKIWFEISNFAITDKIVFGTHFKSH